MEAAAARFEEKKKKKSFFPCKKIILSSFFDTPGSVSLSVRPFSSVSRPLLSLHHHRLLFFPSLDGCDVSTFSHTLLPVSYTHLTLPTIYSV